MARHDVPLPHVRRRHGADAIGLYVGNPLVHNHPALILRQALMSALGTRNCTSSGSQDTSPRFAASWYLYGNSLAVPIPDIDRTHYLLCIGANPRVSNGSFLTAPDVRGRLQAIRGRGGRVVVVDPRRTETAREADEHIPTEGAALGAAIQAAWAYCQVKGKPLSLEKLVDDLVVVEKKSRVEPGKEKRTLYGDLLLKRIDLTRKLNAAGYL